MWLGPGESSSMSATDIQTLSSPAPEPRSREKLEGGHPLVMESEFEPAGDQPVAIAELVEGVIEGEQNQVFLVETGTC